MIPPEAIVKLFYGFSARERVYLTVRALQMAGYGVGVEFNLAILEGKI